MVHSLFIEKLHALEDDKHKLKTRLKISEV
jgi:hypothetical protein